LEGLFVFEFVNKWIIGTSLPIVLIFAGAFFLIFLKFKPFSQPKKLFSAMITPSGDEREGISPFRSVTMALAGTLGVGNIVGVASAIAMGGFGSIFWMWISALFAMILKYAEIVLAVAHRKRGEMRGGAMWYIKDGIKNKRLGGIISGIFAALCILDALSMGCIVQVNALSGAVEGAFGTPKILIGLIVALLTGLVINKGAHGISRITEWLVPLMSLGYVIISVAVMIICRDKLSWAISMIFKDAFNVKSGVGGVAGFLISDGLRYGTMRGLLSNEAGCGTAPFAHAASNQKTPAKQGVWGIFEVFVDTIVLCTMTALVVIVSFDEVCMLAPDGMLMTMRAYSIVLGEWSEYFLAAAVFLFAWATVICWSHYGGECITWLSGERKIPRAVFNFAFCICAFIGAVIAPEEIWTLADFSIGSMTLMNVFTVLLMSGEVKRLTDEVF
jgi:AGCS family alanine or glycine:cation symporter